MRRLEMQKLISEKAYKKLGIWETQIIIGLVWETNPKRLIREA